MAARPDRGGRFGRLIRAGAALAALAVMLAVLSAQGVGRVQAERPLKVVVHVNFAQTAHQKAGLANIENILKTAGAQDVKAEVEVVCHGEGIRLVEKARSELAGEVAALANQGVRFVACENTMRQRSLGLEDLLPGMATVPSGAYEVVHKQQEGYAYFKP